MANDEENGKDEVSNEVLEMKRIFKEKESKLVSELQDAKDHNHTAYDQLHADVDEFRRQVTESMDAIPAAYGKSRHRAWL